MKHRFRTLRAIVLLGFVLVMSPLLGSPTPVSAQIPSLSIDVSNSTCANLVVTVTWTDLPVDARVSVQWTGTEGHSSTIVDESDLRTGLETFSRAWNDPNLSIIGILAFVDYPGFPPGSGPNGDTESSNILSFQRVCTPDDELPAVTLDYDLSCDSVTGTAAWTNIPDGASVTVTLEGDTESGLTLVDGAGPASGSYDFELPWIGSPNANDSPGWILHLLALDPQLGVVAQEFETFDRPCDGNATPDPQTPDPVTPEDDTPVTLPSTGTGQSSSPTSLYILATGALMVVIAAGLTLQRSREERQKRGIS